MLSSSLHSLRDVKGKAELFLRQGKVLNLILNYCAHEDLTLSFKSWDQ